MQFFFCPWIYLSILIMGRKEALIVREARLTKVFWGKKASMEGI